MSETSATKDNQMNETASKPSRPPITRATTLPTTPTSPLATNPWYQQRFELYRDVIEEKLRDEYPNLPSKHSIQPANIEHSTVKGYDLDFPIELNDGQSAIVSLAYGNGPRPPYTKDERRKLITIRQNTTDNQ
ncbi:unnamed protein product [Adineta ricciae]|uniref:Uncharacterized protein n=1 Tax=Adineta ricciae TaxID=249248 RepID=A0A815BVT1_ADIRI|nr:unnamed protein product [Adineta ricciae]CAF1275571.1 unnamed protein product [Adineta ricciae]